MMQPLKSLVFLKTTLESVKLTWIHLSYWSIKDHVIIPIVGASLSLAKTRKLTTNMADKRFETKRAF